MGDGVDQIHLGAQILRHIGHLIKGGGSAHIDPVPELVDAHADLLFRHADPAHRLREVFTIHAHKIELVGIKGRPGVIVACLNSDSVQNRGLLCCVQSGCVRHVIFKAAGWRGSSFQGRSRLFPRLPIGKGVRCGAILVDCHSRTTTAHWLWVARSLPFFQQMLSIRGQSG